MNQVTISAFGGAGDELIDVVTRGSATSMQPNSWNPGCGQLSYARLGCSYARHREDSHPMCGGVFNCTCIGYV
jgi:hypothetical protein